MLVLSRDPHALAPRERQGTSGEIMTRGAAAQRAGKDGELRLFIRPKVGMYGAFSRLNYKPWYAIAEFVDNAIQSFIANGARLEKADGKRHLVVKVSVESDRVVISDNAAGIAVGDLARAFTPAEPPSDPSGLSEFGLGMKAAACWFARRWSVRTKALGEAVERTISFDVPKIVAEGIEHIVVKERPAKSESHFTTVVLEDLNVRPQKRTITKLKNHLASIYRCFIRDGSVEIYYGAGSPDERLQYADPAVLEAPHHKSPTKAAISWRKPIKIELDKIHRITGWAALREKGSLSEAGFAVFRRNRLIQGSYDDPYRPESIFGKPNAFTYQRLFGELHVEGFQVSHTKDGLQWEEWEELILTDLERQLNERPIPLLDQAEGHRHGRARHASPTWGSGAVDDTASAIAEHAPPVINDQLKAKPDSKPPVVTLPAAKLNASKRVELQLHHAHREWAVKIEVANDEGQEDWFTYSKAATDDGEAVGLTIRLNLAHPFSERFGLGREQDLEPLVRIAAAYAIAEVTALQSGVPAAARTVRRNFNQLLRDALSKP
jgi:hypothetical protein